ncbi:Homeobox-like_domain superfamily [Hexamita inflata]|uniref:Homeobox-like domain superfamily n=1 Tax=Hexamita inflata TaxID=28002 RepID=A0AA86R2S5_9EUKA|nr:Homeobox-like domain superfamily [Hexamita inflata]
MNIRQILIDNISLIQAIHQHGHEILNIQFNCIKKYRFHWTRSDDQLLNQAIQLFGTNLDKLHKIIISKTKQQIYSRIRYISENPHLFAGRNLSAIQYK